MTEQSSQFVGNIPENYDRCLGPLIFHNYADDLATRVAETSPSHVLELASGTGILTRRIRDVIPPEAHLIASDLNPPMLDVAARKFTAGENITFREANAMELPFGDDAFDTVVCQFGVMFFPDKPAAFAEVRRVLKPGGRYLFNVWGSMSDNPFSECAHNVVTRYFPDDPPGFYKVPFGYDNQDSVLADMQAGGLRDVKGETVMIDQPVTDWSSFAHGLVFGNPLNDEIKERGGVDSTVVEESILSSLRERFDQEPSSMPLLATVYSGVAP